MKGSRVEVEDLIQEGWIEMWRAIPRYEPREGVNNFDTFMKASARYRMKSVAYGIRQQLAPDRRLTKMARNPLSDIPVDLTTSDAWLFPSTADADASISYHQEQIREAMLELPENQRRAMFNRVWLGQTSAAGLSEGTPYTPTGVYKAMNSAIGKLKVRLAHLKGME